MAQEINGNVDNGEKVWKLNRKLEKKFQTPYSIKMTEGTKLKNRPDIQ